jgi:ribosome-binding protein aMBF1 (putative translation factor)
MGLSQAELAAALGVHWNTLARWERGELTIVRPAWLKAMLDVIEREREERLSTAAGREEHNRRMAAVMHHDLKTTRRRGQKRR